MISDRPGQPVFGVSVLIWQLAAERALHAPLLPKSEKNEGFMTWAYPGENVSSVDHVLQSCVWNTLSTFLGKM